LWPPPIPEYFFAVVLKAAPKLTPILRSFGGARAESLMPQSLDFVKTMIALSADRLPADEIIDEKAPVILS